MLEISLIWMRVGSDLAPAPIEEKTWTRQAMARVEQVTLMHLDPLVMAVFQQVHLCGDVVNAVWTREVSRGNAQK